MFIYITQSNLDWTYLRKTIWAWLEDDQQDTNGDSDLLQLQVVGHPGSPQHSAYAIFGGNSKLTKSDGKTVQFSRRQTQTMDHSLRQSPCDEAIGPIIMPSKICRNNYHLLNDY